MKRWLLTVVTCWLLAVPAFAQTVTIRATDPSTGADVQAVGDDTNDALRVSQVTSIAAGNNNIGDVDVASVTGNVTVVQGTATNLKTQAEAYQGGSAVAAGNPLQVTLANTGANTTALTVNPVRTSSGAITSPGQAVTVNATGTSVVYVVPLTTPDPADTLTFESSYDGGSTWVTLVSGFSWPQSVAGKIAFPTSTYASMLFRAVGETVVTGGTLLLEAVGFGSYADIGIAEIRTDTIQILSAVDVLDDWDETNRAKVNPIVGQAGVQGGSGAVSVTTQRVVLATDVALPAGTNNIGDVDVLSFPDNEPINVAQMNGVAVTMGNGASGTGVQRVTIADDSTGEVRISDDGGNQIPSSTAAPAETARGLNVRPVHDDPCKTGAATHKTISITADTELVAAVASQHVYVCQINLVVAAATNVAITSGTGSVCATSEAGVFGGATAATGWNFAANGGIVLGTGDRTIGRTETAADALCINVSAANQVSGSMMYVQQ